MVGAGFAFAYMRYTTSTLTGYVPFWQRIFGVRRMSPPNHVMPYPYTKTFTGYCHDSDKGLNIFVKGYCNSTAGSPGEDYCVNEFAVNEKICGSINNTPVCITVTKRSLVGYVCKNGACIRINESCYDTDGGLNFFVAGKCRDNQGVFYDTCKDGNIIEYLCTSTGCTKVTQPCINLTAPTGRCVANACEYARWIRIRVHM